MEHAHDEPAHGGLEDLLAALQRRWGSHAALRGSALTHGVATVPTGFAGLDGLVGGGVPRGAITELLGAPTSGMTTVALSLIAQAQARGDLAVYLDLSSTFDAEHAAARGVDLDSLLLVRPRQISQTLDLIQALVASQSVGVLVADSLSLLQAREEGRARLGSALRVLPGALGRSPCALLALTTLPYSAAMLRSLAFRGSLLAGVAALRLHVARERWLDDGPIPGCRSRVTVLRRRGVPPGDAAAVTIDFPDL